jgi:hypothetical protein
MTDASFQRYSRCHRQMAGGFGVACYDGWECSERVWHGLFFRRCLLPLRLHGGFPCRDGSRVCAGSIYLPEKLDWVSVMTWWDMPWKQVHVLWIIISRPLLLLVAVMPLLYLFFATRASHAHLQLRIFAAPSLFETTGMFEQEQYALGQGYSKSIDCSPRTNIG